MHGICTSLHSESLIEGQFKNGAIHGFARHLFRGGKRYSIGWHLESKMHGYGYQYTNKNTLSLLKEGVI